MKQYWKQIALRIDVLTLRERLIIFAMAALILIVLVNTALLDPQRIKQKQLSQRIKQEQSQIAGLQAQIQQRTSSRTEDPDAANKVRLQHLKEQSAQMHAALQDVQKGLVSTDKIAELLEGILRENGALRLVSLKTMTVSPVIEQANTGAKGIKNAAVSPKHRVGTSVEGLVVDTVYKHGVEIVVQGGYLDITNYLAQLEAMPWQLLWGRAKLNVHGYPQSTLTLTLFTLSLDEKWLNL